MRRGLLTREWQNCVFGPSAAETDIDITHTYTHRLDTQKQILQADTRYSKKIMVIIDHLYIASNL